MTAYQKHTIAWILVLTALAISSLGGSYIYLHDNIQTNPEFIETNLSEVAVATWFNLEGARKANYSDEEIFVYLAKANQAKFEQQWYCILAIIGSLYFVLVIGVLAIRIGRINQAQ